MCRPFNPPSRLAFALLFASLHAACAQHHPHGRGAISAQDLAHVQSRIESPSTPVGISDLDPADLACARFPAGSVASDPPEFKSQNGLLEVTIHFLTATDAQGLTRYCYVTSSGLEAPTLRVNPGDRLIIHFQNMLPAQSASSSADYMAGMKMSLSSKTQAPSTPCYGTMSATSTNLHFHGTNVAPVCGQDEVLHTLLQPGDSFDYNVQIPANEPPGLYWYHPHPHGFSEAQVQGGATGALIVDGIQNVVPSLAGMTERIFVLRDQLLPDSELNDNNIPAWDLSLNYIPVTFPAYTPAIVKTAPAQREFWRVANTSADTILDLQYIVKNAAQPMQVVAIDGFPIAAGSSGLTTQETTDILLPPGARAEFVVTTPNVGEPAQLITQYWNTGPDGDFNPARPIANIMSEPAATNREDHAALRLPSDSHPVTVTRFRALASAAPVAVRTLYFSEVLQDPSNPNSPTNFYITERGQQPALFAIDQPPNIVVHSGTVEDWVIQNTTLEDHIFHIHQIHFQVLEQNGQPVNDPALRDTVDLPYWTGSGPYPSVKLRMDFRDPNIVGTFVYHCHILQHEDGGMMAEIKVLPSTGAASATSATASATRVAPNAQVKLTVSVKDVATGKLTPTGLVQFQLNGIDLGDPVQLANGQASKTAPVNGNAGTNSLEAFYQGDSTYAESVSTPVAIAISNFSLSSTGANASVGAAAIAPIAVNVADNYTPSIQFTCALPANLTESACFVNPNFITGSGQVALTVNTTPAHPSTGNLGRPGNWFAAGGSTGLACIFLLFRPRRRYPSHAHNRAALLLAALALVFSAVGCGAATKLDPGTAKGSYLVAVTGTAGSGATQYQATANIPITIH